MGDLVKRAPKVPGGKMYRVLSAVDRWSAWITRQSVAIETAKNISSAHDPMLVIEYAPVRVAWTSEKLAPKPTSKRKAKKP